MSHACPCVDYLFPDSPFSHKQIAGVEPVSPAWEASVLPMNYICIINLLTEYLTGQNQSNTHSGAYGIRTHGLHNANVARSQLR